MLNITKWFKDEFQFPEGGEELVNKVTDLFTNNEEIVEKASTAISFKNGARMIIRMASKAVEAKTEE